MMQSAKAEPRDHANHGALNRVVAGTIQWDLWD